VKGVCVKVFETHGEAVRGRAQRLAELMLERWKESEAASQIAQMLLAMEAELPPEVRERLSRIAHL